MSVAIETGGPSIQPTLNRAVDTQSKAAPAPAAAAGAPAGSADKVNLSTNATQGSSNVKVDSWKKGKNDCLEHILLNQGYSMNEIYGKGQTAKVCYSRWPLKTV